ncbi:type II secretion system protein M [Verticiella sediminum]|uniref:Type II secretion system protein M n=1 Tax=Verticiella sediminum TaxID=1247510 RepID=A0A556ACP1_9BURK|nr:type II secretion system protein GspM [Verticiella sediminum]TSH90649.1 type II secretion system protein M [Verticiella sediminum]
MSRRLSGSSPQTQAQRGLQARYGETRRAVATRWQRLVPRERRLVSLAATLAGVALTWQFLFLPAWRTTRAAADTLPALRAQAAQLDTVIAQARASNARQARAGAPIGETDLAASLTRAGLATHASVSREARHWQVTLRAAPIEPVLGWLRDVGTELRLRPTRVDLSRVADDAGAILPGLVSGGVDLSAAGDDGGTP